MEVFLTIERASFCDIELERARRPTEEEKKHYNPDWHDWIFIGMGEHIQLPHIGWEDLPKRPSDGSFPGCSNQAWIITQEKWDRFIALENERSAAEKAKDRTERLNYLHQTLAAMKKQPKLYTQEEAKAQRKRYNNVYNEGAEGYIPHFYTIDEYHEVLEEIEKLESDA